MAASRTSRRTAGAKRNHGVLWYVTWPLHVVPRWFLWLLWHFLASFCLGLLQGARIGWYIKHARWVLNDCKKRGETMYDLDIWQLLRTITFERQRNYDGVVVCKTCKLPTTTPHCHHKKHVAYHPTLAFTPSNLVGLCPACHQAEHPDLNIAQAPRAPRQTFHVDGVRKARGRRLRRKHRVMADQC
jgi:5-methylcytosine-specific restriction endonuclease McrA